MINYLSLFCQKYTKYTYFIFGWKTCILLLLWELMFNVHLWPYRSLQFSLISLSMTLVIDKDIYDQTSLSMTLVFWANIIKSNYFLILAFISKFKYKDFKSNIFFERCQSTDILNFKMFYTVMCSIEIERYLEYS